MTENQEHPPQPEPESAEQDDCPFRVQHEVHQTKRIGRAWTFVRGEPLQASWVVTDCWPAMIDQAPQQDPESAELPPEGVEYLRDMEARFGPPQSEAHRLGRIRSAWVFVRGEPDAASWIVD